MLGYLTGAFLDAFIWPGCPRQKIQEFVEPSHSWNASGQGIGLRIGNPSFSGVNLCGVSSQGSQFVG